MKHCYLFDLDGTLADCSHRLHHIQKLPKDWDAFFGACGADSAIKHICDLAGMIVDHGASIVFVSGRSDQCREQTEAWLYDQLGFSEPLYMRKAGDYRPDDIVKGELVDRVLADGWHPIMAFEDRSRVVDMLRKRGIPCAQVADGNF